jgi:hypothetical protein
MFCQYLEGHKGEDAGVSGINCQIENERQASRVARTLVSTNLLMVEITS